jgi:hypothetical protein
VERLSTLHTLGLFGHIACAEGDYSRTGALYQKSMMLRWELRDTHLLAESLEDFASLAGRQGKSPNIEDPAIWIERTARLLGAAEALCQTLGRNTPAANPKEHARTRDIARAELGEGACAVTGTDGRIRAHLTIR